MRVSARLIQRLPHPVAQIIREAGLGARRRCGGQHLFLRLTRRRGRRVTRFDQGSTVLPRPLPGLLAAPPGGSHHGYEVAL